MEIHKRDLPDILKDLPEIERFNSLQEWDAIVCALGFEDRSHAIVDEIAANGIRRGATLLLIRYPTNDNDNRESERFFLYAARQMAGLQEIRYSRHDHSTLMAHALQSGLLKQGSRVLFDISSCSSYVFYPTIKELLNCDISLTIGYSEAKTYYPTKDEWSKIASNAKSENSLFVQSFENAGFQSLGVDDIYSYPLFSEMNPGNRPGVLVAVPNFSVLRMNAIRTRDRETNNTPFEKVHWLIGVPPGRQNKWRMDAIKATNNLDNALAGRITHVSTYQYKEMLKTLEAVWLDNCHSSYISVGPLGSKMQHVGTFLFLYLHQDVGLWLAEPKEFRASRFSKGCGPTWQLEIGSTKALREKLNGYMTFAWKF